MTKKKVGIFIPTLKNGGMEKVASNLSIYLDEKYNIYIILYDKKDIEFKFKGEIYGLDEPAFNDNILQKIIKFIRRVKKLKELKKELKLDTVISFSEGPNIINLLSKTKEKVIFTVHSIKSKRLKGYYGIITKLFIKLFYNRADKIIAVSNLIKIDLIKEFRIKESNIKVIYNPINEKEIKSKMIEEIDEEYIKIFNKKVLINIGRLESVKAQDKLIKAFSLICKKRDDINLLILGDGRLKEELKNLVKDLDIEENVFIIGYKENAIKFLYRSDLFVLTSVVEGFPNVIIESMYCSTPFISTDCKLALREVIDDEWDLDYKIQDVYYGKYGILIPDIEKETKNIDTTFTKEESDIGEMILNILNDPCILEDYKSRIKEKSNKFVINKIIKEWEEIL